MAVTREVRPAGWPSSSSGPGPASGRTGARRLRAAPKILLGGAKRGGEFFNLVGFWQDLDTGAFGVPNRRFGVSAGQQHRDVASPSLDLSRELDPIHATRHHDVGEHDVDRATIREGTKSGGRAGGARDVVSELREHLADECGNLVIIF